MKQHHRNFNGFAIVLLIMIINNSAALYISEKPFRYHCRDALKYICADDLIVFSLSNQQYSLLFSHSGKNSNILDKRSLEKNEYAYKKKKPNVTAKIDCCVTQCNFQELRQHCQ